ncbi:FRG domain-containing protein [Leuconostoc sp. JNUCC 76]
MKNMKVLVKNANYQINNLDGFFEFVRMANNSGYSWYRGQRDNSWDIESTISRDKVRTQSNSISTIKYTIKNFKNNIERIKSIVESDAKYESIAHLQLNNLQFGLLAQHYGFKTPFIDWTADPNIALFFAIDGFIDCYDADTETSTMPVIYATNPKILNYYAALSSNGHDISDVLSSDDVAVVEYYTKQVDSLNPDGDATNSFINPIAIETNLDFCHRITRQSGKFTIKGPKNPMEDVQLRNMSYDIGGSNESKFFISAVLNFDKNFFHSDLMEYLEEFNYTKRSVYRLGDQNSELLDKLFTRHFLL